MAHVIAPAVLAALAAAGIPLLEGQAPQKPDLPTTAPAAAPTAPPIDLLTFGLQDSRMTVPVSIGAKGPYRFVIDTGAERTVVSRELAGALNLIAGRSVHVTTITGQGDFDTYMIPEIRAGTVGASTLEAPVVDAQNLGAAGMLGLDALKGHIVVIDFDRNVLEVRPATKRRNTPMPGDIVVRAKNVFGQLIVTDAKYRDRNISVVIDTGSPVTIGNLALLKRVRTARSMGHIGLISVTGDSLPADYRLIDMLSLGGVGFQNVPIAFADALPFKRFGLSDTPALMLGMDTLKLFRRVEIDFANREIRLTLPRRTFLNVTTGSFESRIGQ